MDSVVPNLSIDATGLIRRFDDAPEVLGSRRVAHFCDSYRTIDGHIMATRR